MFVTNEPGSKRDRPCSHKSTSPSTREAPFLRLEGTASAAILDLASGRRGQAQISEALSSRILVGCGSFRVLRSQWLRRIVINNARGSPLIACLDLVVSMRSYVRENIVLDPHRSRIHGNRCLSRCYFCFQKLLRPKA